MFGTIPTNTDTRAYNANNVASVYISSAYGDLVSTSEAIGGNPGTLDTQALSLQNGVYGMSDPANLKGLVEKFEVELTQGGTSKGTYRLRLINPTDELEVFIFGIYNAAFPGSHTMDLYAEAAKYNKELDSVPAPGGEGETPFTQLLKRGLQLPFLFLRWGYGTSEDEGLSRIHKCVLFGCEYTMNANQDKIIELHLIDWFSHMADNNTFNIRPKLTKTECLVTNGKDTTLLPVSVILTNLIQKYTDVFKGVYTFYDTNSGNMKYLDSLVNEIAKSRWAEYADLSSEDAEGNPTKFDPNISRQDIQNTLESIKEGDIKLSPADRLSFLIDDAPFTSDKELTVLQQILISATKQVLNFLGINLEHSSAKDTAQPVAVDAEGDPVPIDSQSAMGEAWIEASNKIKINVGDRTDFTFNNLTFYVPQWMPATPTTPFILTDPNALASTLPVKQPFGSRRVNYNQSIPMQAEMVDLIGSNFVGGFLAPAKNARPGAYDKHLRSQSDRKRRTEQGTNIWGQELPNKLEELDAASFEMGYKEFETIVNNITKLLPTINSGANIYDNTPEADLMPSVFIPRIEKMTSFFPSFAAVAHYHYFLYIPPILTAQTIEPNPYLSINPPHFQQDGFTSNTVDVYSTNIMNFKLGLESLRAFIRLVPTPQTVAALQTKLKSIQAEISANALDEQRGSFLSRTKDAVGDLVAPLDSGLSRLERDTSTENLNAAYKHKVTASLGTGNSDTPHITQTLVTLVNGINKLVIEKNPFVVQQVDLHNLTSEKLDEIFETGVLKVVGDAKDQFKEEKPTVLLIGQDTWLQDSFAGGLLNKVNSFPEITREEEEYNNLLFLDYGKENSIITDLKFKGDTRVLLNIPQTIYATLQQQSLQNFFEGATQEGTEELLKDLMSFLFENKIEADLKLLRDEKASGGLNAEELEAKNIEIEKKKDELRKVTQIEQVDYTVYEGYFDMFPDLLSNYDDETLKKAGFQNPSHARTLVSVLGTKEFTDLLFPVKTIETVLKKDTTVLSLDKSREYITSEDHIITEIVRQLDVASFYPTIQGMTAAAMDAKMNYIRSAQNQVWQVNITTLGIPEIDVMGAEFYARKIVLTVDPSRSGSKLSGDAAHWLTGIYAITGIKHDLSPSQGYSTSLSLVKLPERMLGAIQ